MQPSGGSMSKVRVYEVAKQLNLDPKAVVSLFQQVGINEVRNHMSSVEPEAVERVKRHLEKQKTHDVVEERIRATVIKRRAIAKPGGEAPSSPSLPGVPSSPASSRDFGEASRSELPAARSSRSVSRDERRQQPQRVGAVRLERRQRQRSRGRRPARSRPRLRA